MAKEIILSGIQPTGKLHIGNYFGALKNFIKLQNEHQCFFTIVDYHSITANYDPKTKQAQILETAKEFLAAGLDPKKCTLFIQSYVPEHMELFHIFNTITPVSLLFRMTQFKDKSGVTQIKEIANKKNIEIITKNIQNIETKDEFLKELKKQKEINIQLANNFEKMIKSNTGLFTYPILQAADILIYKTTAVPVGKDQEQHLELTREIARFFNNKFGQTFVEPKTLTTEVPKVMSLLEPGKKMSKSLGDNHCIYLDDEPEIIKKKIGKAVTDSGDGKAQGAQNLLGLLKLFSTQKVYKKFTANQQSGNIRYGDLKTQLAKDIANYFSDFRKEKSKLTDAKVKKIFTKGAKQARKVAQATMEETRQKIGIR